MIKIIYLTILVYSFIHSDVVIAVDINPNQINNIEQSVSKLVVELLGLPKSEVVKNSWKDSSFGLGGILATGDSTLTNINVISTINYKLLERWNNSLFLNYIYSVDNRGSSKNVKINKSQIKFDTSWNFNEITGTYARISYLSDQLNTFQYALTESVGYKRSLYMNDSMKLYFTIGPSLMQSKRNITGKKVSDYGGQSILNYTYNFGEKSNFKQNFLFNYTAKNKVIYQSYSALSIKLYENLSLQLSFQLDRTSKVSLGKNAINTITSTNIMYSI